MNIDYVRLIRVRPNVLSGFSGKGRIAGRALRAIPDGFWLEGHLSNPIQVGQPVEVKCTCYEGKLCICGRVYKTTEVTKIRGDSIFTENAQFKVLRVPRFDPIKSLRAWQ